LALVWAHVHRLFEFLMSTGAPASWIKNAFAQSGGQQITPDLFERDPDYWLDVTHPRRIDRGTFLLAGISYGFGDRAQEFASEAYLENTDQVPELPLLRDPTLARDGTGSFMGGDRGGTLSGLLGPEQVDLYSRETLRSLVENALAELGDSHKEHLAWASIHAVIGDLPPYEDLRDKLAEAVRRTDFAELTRSNAQTGLLALRTASQLALNVGNENLRGWLKEQLVEVAGLFKMDNSSDPRRASVEDLMERAELGPLVDSALALAVAASFTEAVHSEFAALLDRFVSIWPWTAPLFKLISLRLCEELPITQNKHYWPLLIRLRAE